MDVTLLAARTKQPTGVGTMGAVDRLSEWMGRYQRGEGEVLAQLYREVAPGMLSYLYRLVNDRALAEDLLQEVFLRIHKVRHTYRPESPAKPWMYAIARYVAIDSLRKKGRRHEVAYEEEHGKAGNPDALEQTERSESMEQVEMALLGLPAGQREAFVLTKVAGLSVEEASAVLGISQGAVKVRVHRALGAMRESLTSNEESEEDTDA
jgi:RNA polymerase sigma-70 factor (ECF subfamily)